MDDGLKKRSYFERNNTAVIFLDNSDDKKSLLSRSRDSAALARLLTRDSTFVELFPSHGLNAVVKALVAIVLS